MADPQLLGPFPAPDPDRFPNTRLRSHVHRPDSTPQESQPSHSTNDPDTCRICRGEGTPEEPLFYPCRCSGSIKHVHQDCLMEWLSHSQKKHCELCKTPFRFTKLYDPNMPKALPWHVFASHMAKYIFANMLLWMRASLVVLVWLGALPYLMRSVWRLLFWFSDDGMAAFLFHQRQHGRDKADQLASAFGTTPNPAGNLFGNNTTLATNLILPGTACIAKGASSVAQTSNEHSPTATIFRLLFGTPDASGAVTNEAASISTRNNSLLSGVRFLRNLTRHPWLNDKVIEIIEGQIVTILVIVCFILIILVRDYVVQQQPEINMRAAFAAAENAPLPAPPQEPPALVEPAPAGQEHHDDPAQWEDLQGQWNDPAIVEQPPHLALEARRQIALARLQAHERRLQRQWAEPEVRDQARYADDYYTATHEVGDNDPNNSAATSRTRSAFLPSSSFLQRVELDALVNAGEFADPKNRPLHDFLAIYQRAKGDPHRILEIARDQGAEERLDYWLTLTRTLLDRQNRAVAGVEDHSDASSAAENTPASSTDARFDNPDLPPSGGLRPPIQTVDWTPFSTHEGDAAPQHDRKGKGILREDSNSGNVGGEASESHLASPLRPRANTDGPKISDAIHPLANNSWSFQALPEQEPDSSLNDRHGFESASSGHSTFGSPEQPAFRQGVSPTFSGRLDFTRPRFAETAFDLDQSTQPTPLFSNRADEEMMLDHSILKQESSTSLMDITSGAETAQLENSRGSAPLQNGEDVGAQAEQQTPDVPAPRPQPVGIVDRLADFMWRDVDGIDPAELAAADPLQFEVEDGDLADDEVEDEVPEVPERDREVVEAAVAAGLDPEAIEDAEDLEGILELLGMRGPVAGLFQNAIFCSFLVSITVFLGIVVPYNIGRITVWMVANPIRPARILFGLCMLVQDFAIVLFGSAVWFGAETLLLFTAASRVLGPNVLGSVIEILTTISSLSFATMVSAINRVGSSFVAEFTYISGTEIQNFSAISHEALLHLKGHIRLAFTALVTAVEYLSAGNYAVKSSDAASLAGKLSTMAMKGLKQLPSALTNPNSWVLHLSLPDSTAPVFDAELAQWNGTDRFWAMVAGYVAISVMAGLYLRRGSPLFTGPTGQDWEASIIDGLNQASGVMKVILIIGIEMLVFPLYCGLLLDLALLPLFEGATVKSRVIFTMNYPVTSIFVHWFVGTGYMFHFALFVSMCRKIMRKGVLYFIRDPDDPEFHPVRDVLERSVTTQLRKILFSALVYGALVMVCLGGVVWGLALSVSSVLPIHYSSNEPVLEFPIDLLFYNFLMPLAVRYFKPSDGLHAMYTWWFRKCARALRVTWFLFGERRIDEEGELVLKSDSPDSGLPLWRKLFLEVENDQVRAKKWTNFFEPSPDKPTVMRTEEALLLNTAKKVLIESGQLIPDGRYVRAPCSDQVKIPKGRRVFLDVSEDNKRRDDVAPTDLYNSEEFQFVYVPPHFRLRVFLFITFIWVFAAVTGVSFTILPLVFGRWMFRSLLPNHIHTNDIYAFSIGIYILGSATYAAFHARTICHAMWEWANNFARSVVNGEAVRPVVNAGIRVAKIIYAYFFFYIIFPLMVASLMELYALMPLHEVMYGALLKKGDGASELVHGITPAVELNAKHTVRVIQGWTIGLLYLKLSTRIITAWFPGTRIAAAVVAIFRHGWLHPDVAVLTRAFIVPGIILWCSAVISPFFLARFSVANGLGEAMFQSADGTLLADHDALRRAYEVLIYRLSYPAMAVLVVWGFGLWSMFGVFKRWNMRIRDEAYLIGERLHNFGTSVGNGTPKGKNTAWRGTPGRI
ncbi:hypothetical protein QBC36DRAFT_320674 [Triangularia setosa]|uniref:RING-type E3 ubiquitin transferase n=1 Tax=Triangularia setosa TaxID=2587417 RepID=A0AAN6WEA2_9PEZI|nr:hypothetical protein QBC36DRAFT_320674 [Podospora setosa]